MRALERGVLSLLLVAVTGMSVACSATSPEPAEVSPSASAPASTSPPASPSSPASASASPGAVWAPVPGVSWQWQLSGEVDTTVRAEVFDIDGDSSAALVGELHATGARVICYISAGSWEEWRADADDFPESVKGRPLDGWAGEQWLDIRRLDVLLPIMDSRIAACRAKGFDAVEPDNVDGYANDSGFPLTAADQLAYNQAIAGLAHSHGLGVGLKNDADQVQALVGHFDFAVVEECVAYRECAAWTPFVEAGKGVLHAEYSGSLSRICATTQPLGLSTIKKRLDLDAYRRAC